MGHKKSSSFSKTIINVVMAIPTIFRLMSNVISLVECEARKAGKSIIIIFILCVLGGSLLTTIWLCVLAMLLVYFISLKLSVLMSLFIILVLNLALFFILTFTISKVKNGLCFSKTRHLFRKINHRP